MHPLLLTVLTLVAEFVGAAILCYLVGGMIWLFSGRKRPFPRRAILVFALVLFAVSVPRNLPGIRAAFQERASVEGISSVVNTFRNAVGGAASGADLRSAVRGLNPVGLSDESASMLAGIISLSANRYGDLLQSSYHAQVIRTPISLSVPSGLEEELSSIDEQWTPHLLSASRGEPVRFAEVAGEADDLYLYSLLAAWARYESLDELSNLRGAPGYLSEDERRIGSALSWLPLLLTDTGGDTGTSELIASLAAAQATYAWSEDLGLVRLEAGPALSDEILIPFLIFNQLVTEADLETSVSIMRSVVGNGDTADWDSINSRRRALGLPVILVPEDLTVAARYLVLPWQVDDAGMAISQGSEARLTEELTRIREGLRFLESQRGS